MYTDVYVDVLFLVNLAMDAVSLSITSRLCSLKLQALRVLIASSIGAVYSVASVFISFGGGFEIPVFLAVSVIMVCISFRPETFRDVAKLSIVLFISSALLGGVMSALYSLMNDLLRGSGIVQNESYTISPALFFALGGVSFLSAIFLCRLHGSGNYPDSADVEIKLWKKSVKCRGIIDSGNMLSDPLSGRPVVIVRESSVRSLFPSWIRLLDSGRGAFETSALSDEERVRFRLIPAKGIGGDACLCGFVPDEITVEYKKKGRGTRKKTNAVFAVVSDQDIDVECIIPSVLL